MESVLSIKRLSVGYMKGRTRRVVQHSLDGDLNEGDFVCLLGKNGTGKSTLLRTLTGLQPALAGKVEIQGRLLSSYSTVELARMLSLVLTDKSYIDLTVEELVALGRTPYTGYWNTLSQNDRKVVQGCLRETGLTDFKRRLVSTLSDGERQRVFIAKALAQQTPVVLLDEPTAFLDFPSKVEIFRLMRELALEHGKTVLLSTHDLSLALRFADSLWMLGKDKPLLTGSPMEISRQGALDSYLGGKGYRFSGTEIVFE